MNYFVLAPYGVQFAYSHRDLLLGSSILPLEVVESAALEGPEKVIQRQ